MSPSVGEKQLAIPATVKKAADWGAQNRCYLYAFVAGLKEQLSSAIDAEKKDFTLAQQPLPEPTWADTQSPPALTLLKKTLGLSDFDVGVLLLCVAMDLDPTMALLYAQIQGNPPRPYPTLNLALQYFGEHHWNALVPTAPLRYWQLIQPVGEDTLTGRSLQIDERILHYLMGVTYFDPALETCVTPMAVPTTLPPSQSIIAAEIVRHWQVDPGTLVNIYGSTAASRAAIVQSACQQLGGQAYGLDREMLPTDKEQRAAFQQRWAREAVLSNCILFVPIDVSLGQEQSSTLKSFWQRQKGRVVLSSDEPVSVRQRSVVRWAVQTLEPTEQIALWQRSLVPLAGKSVDHFNHQIRTVVSQFNLDSVGIVHVSERVKQQNVPGNKLEDDQLWAACRQAARVTLDDLAQRLEPMASWDELVLPVAQQRTLAAIVASVQQRSQVYEAWGFAGKSRRGLGISALFAGGSGTGKTMSAEVLSQVLNLDLYRIDLSAVVSKYIGETEKNLRQIFDAAEQGGAILLFDEADALFSKRSEVKDSHDRHANIEVSYLLQRLEAYQGLAILTTNFKSAIDAAFLRRIRFVVTFPFPDISQRLRMWQRALPAQTPTEGLDFDRLAKLAVPGGNIASIAMNAAFLAAADASPIRMQHLLRAAQSEYGKLDKKLSESEVRGWV